MLAALGQRKGTNFIEIPCALPIAMRANPTLATSNFLWVGSSPTGNQAGFFDTAAGLWITQSGGLGSGAAVPASPSAVVVRLQAASSFSGAAGSVGQLYLGNLAYIALQAEL